MDVKEVFPLDFWEFAKAVGVEGKIIAHINKAFETHTPVDVYVHKTIMKLLYLYLVVGGMPAAVQTYIDTKDISSVQMKQKEILSTNGISANMILAANFLLMKYSISYHLN